MMCSKNTRSEILFSCEILFPERIMEILGITREVDSAGTRRQLFSVIYEQTLSNLSGRWKKYH
jgi:hypothetical protein